MQSIALLLLLLAAVLLVAVGGAEAFLWGSSKPAFKQPKHADGVTVADLARHDLPPVVHGGRVTHLMSGMHFDNLLQDTPDELRPPSVIYFTGFESCASSQHQQHQRAFVKMAESELPSRERLLVAMYDMDANPKRGWFKFTPEMDLAKRYGLTAAGAKDCGQVVFVPRGAKCNGFTKYCTEPSGTDALLTKVGCSDFVDECAPLIKRWYPAAGDFSTYPLAQWILQLVQQQGEPQVSPVFGSYVEQSKWLRQRDETTTDNEFRNYFLVESFPAFTPLGFSAVPIPQEMQQWLVDFWNRKKAKSRVNEGWSAGSTQMNFHEEPTTFVSLDQEARMRDKLANEIIKPIVEKWSGMDNLELTSFYGLREYKAANKTRGNLGSYLKSHIDRIDTHVLSVTFTVAKLNSSDPDQMLTAEEERTRPTWPLEVVAFDGQIYRHAHPGGTMILYESSKLAHGRPYHNNAEGAMDHLGCFCHFKPVNKDKLAAEKWDRIATEARENQARNTQAERYVSLPVQEPTVPVFSKHRIGAGTGWKGDGGEDDDDDDDPNQFVVSFVNQHDSALDLYWLGHGGSAGKVLQGTLASGASMEMTTFVGHKFVWTEQDKPNKPMPRGKFEIELGSRVYRYGAGSARKAKA